MTLVEALCIVRMMSRCERRDYRQQGDDRMLQTVCVWTQQSPQSMRQLYRAATVCPVGEVTSEQRVLDLLQDGQVHNVTQLCSQLGHCTRSYLFLMTFRLRAQGHRLMTDISSNSICLEPGLQKESNG